MTGAEGGDTKKDWRVSVLSDGSRAPLDCPLSEILRRGHQGGDAVFVEDLLGELDAT